eukprot:GHVQ01039043.1.p1 GENE.GHVQ01039043.1~~GHVQ01039043.1.p1  ORF type:complete len:121 (-),score=12.68 GHVQ01039043.1:160-522(-)
MAATTAPYVTTELPTSTELSTVAHWSESVTSKFSTESVTSMVSTGVDLGSPWMVVAGGLIIGLLLGVGLGFFMGWMCRGRTREVGEPNVVARAGLEEVSITLLEPNKKEDGGQDTMEGNL